MCSMWVRPSPHCFIQLVCVTLACGFCGYLWVMFVAEHIDTQTADLKLRLRIQNGSSASSWQIQRLIFGSCAEDCKKENKFSVRMGKKVYSLLTCRGVEQLLNILRFKTNFLNIFGVFGFMFKFYFPQASRAPHTSSYRIVKLKLQVYSPSSSSRRGRIILQMYETTRGVLDLLFEPRKHPQTASVGCMWGEMVQKLLITSRV